MGTFRIVACGLAVAAMTLLGARTAAAGTVYVDNNLSDYAGHDGSSWQLAYKTIQDGVNAAADGDTVLVAPGVYGDDQGTRASSLNGGAEEPVAPGVIRKRLAGGDNVFAFRFEGAGAAYLKSFSDVNGTLLLLR